MSEGAQYPRRHVYIDDETWDAVRQMARQVAMEEGKNVSASEYIRRACNHRINYDEGRLTRRSSIGV